MEDEVLDMGMKYGVVRSPGSWFRYEDTQLAQGRERHLPTWRTILNWWKEISKKVKDAHTKAMKVEDVDEDFYVQSFYRMSLKTRKRR